MQSSPPAADIFSSASFVTSSTSRPTTRDGAEVTHSIPAVPSVPAPRPPLVQTNSSSNVPTSSSAAAAATKDRKPSFSRKAASFSSPRRRGSSTTSNNANGIVTDATAPPALPDYALSAAAKVASRDGTEHPPVPSPASPDNFHKMISRTTTGGTAAMPPPPTPVGGQGGFWQSNGDAGYMHQQIRDLANKRIATLDYLRRSHSGRVYWFNSYLFDKTDLSRMPCFDPRRLSRKATNYMLLGISLPVLVDLYSSTPQEFLRSFGTLLSEFDSFQQLRNDSSASLSRARLPNMFRRPGTKSRRSTSAADSTAEDAAAAFPMAGNGGIGGAGASGSTPSVMNFAASESDLLQGEEYAHLLTPSLPFDPDYFETFATLCDALVDCYTRFLALVPTSRECTASVAELFTKADARVRKILIQGVVKEFEDSSRAHVKTEVASIGKVVLGGLM